jgi:hypothetical protein
MVHGYMDSFMRGLGGSVRTWSWIALLVGMAACVGQEPAPTGEPGGGEPQGGAPLAGSADPVEPVHAAPAPESLPAPVDDGAAPTPAGDPSASAPAAAPKTPHNLLSRSALYAQGPAGVARAAHLTYLGGPLIQSAKVYHVLWGAPGPGHTFIPEVTNGTTAGAIGAYLDGGWLDWIAAEYSTTFYKIGRPSFAASVTLTLLRAESKGQTVNDSDVQDEIGAQIAAGKLPADPNAMFLVSFPAEVTVQQLLLPYGRGVGTIPTTCGDGHENQAGLCYPLCSAGYHGVGPVCWQTCPAGYSDDGLTCRKPGAIISADNSKCPWYDVCGLTFSKGCSTCPAGYHDDGCTCRIDPVIFGKASYGRGVGTLPGCAVGQVEDAGLCYPPCISGYTGVGPLCWGHDRFCGGHSGFCGYHSSFLHGVTDVRYAVLADMGPGSACFNDCWTGAPFSDLTKTFAHELVEAITDPDIGTGWNDLSKGEIGDICNDLPVSLPGGPTGSFVVQDEFSNASSSCRH